MNQEDKIIRHVIRLANLNYPDSEIYLFGSRARGDVRHSSDWDFLILLDRDSIPFELETKVMDDFYEIELETGEVLSPLIYSKPEWQKKYLITPLYKNIQKEGIKIK